MSETISIMFDENGIAKEYDDTFDITIHCKSEEEQNKVLEILNRRWIPVSERLPEETGWYIVTFRVYGGGYAVCELSYRKPENYWTDKDIFKKALSNDEILAWMPLPERYKDGE